MAGVSDDFNEDDFDDYNPHPYLGGYDLAQTYGQPLPPSAAICYPISLPPPGKVNSSSDGLPVNEATKESEQESDKPVITPVVEQPWFEPHPYDEPYQPEPYKPDLFRSWPFSNPRHHCCHTRKGVRDFDYWNHMMRGLDFLFGHAQGYGERRVGTDVYGIPMYANKRSPTESVALLVEQPSVQRLEYHQLSDVEVHPDGLDSEVLDTNDTGTTVVYFKVNHTIPVSNTLQLMQQPSWYEERKEEKHEKYGNSYQIDDSYNYEQSGSNWGHDSSYHDTYHDWRYNNLGYSSNVEGEYMEENKVLTSPVYSYNQHYHEPPLHVQLEPADQTWTQKMISYEGYSSNVEGEYMEENKVLTSPVYSYNQHYHEQPLHVQVEPADQTWTQKMISYENNHSSYYEKGEEVHQPNILSHGYGRERYEETQYEHLEPYKPSWSQNLGYYGKYLEGETVRSEDHSTFYGGEGNVSTAFAYNEGNTYYEQNQSSWSTGDSHVLYGEDISNKPNWEDPSNWTVAIFGSSHNYYVYDH